MAKKESMLELLSNATRLIVNTTFMLNVLRGPITAWKSRRRKVKTIEIRSLRFIVKVIDHSKFY